MKKTDTSLVFSDPAEDSLTEILEQLEREAGGHEDREEDLIKATDTGKTQQEPSLRPDGKNFFKQTD